MEQPIWKIIKGVIKRVYAFFPFKKEFCYVIKYLRIPVGSFYKYLWFKGKISVEVNGNYMSLYNFGDTIENEVFWKGINKLSQNAQLETWMKLCEISSTIFDIGANTGIYCLTAKLVNPQASVFAFEPSVKTYYKLIKNIQVNKFDILAEQIALSNRSGQEILYDVFGGHQYSASLSPEKLKNFKWFNKPIKEYYVKTETLSDYILRNNIDKIDLIKIDVELHEPEVLDGLADYLWKFKPVFFIEVLTEEVARKINNIFERTEYLIFNFNEDNKLTRVDKVFGKWRIPNFLFCTGQPARFLGIG